MKDYFLFYKSPLGWLKIHSDGVCLKSIIFVENEEDVENSMPRGILKKTVEQLTEYFQGKRQSFDLEIEPEGTSFQKKVWQSLQTVGFGQTKNYNDIAKELGSTRYCRAVGLANGKNPLPIIIPCHRIIGTNGKLVGYSGGLAKKKWLLLHEQKYSGKLLF
jgi:methylated-DNA-[protein]-cysteine S-methyltransferase